MRSIVNFFGNPTDPSEQYGKRLQTSDFVRTRGTQRIPFPPRDVFVQSASRGILVTWKLPNTKNTDIDSWRVYKGDENTLYTPIADRGIRQCYVEGSAGTPSSQTFNIFVSSVNALGKESKKIQAQGAPTPETAAPAVPSVPPGYTSENAGGGDTSSGLGDRGGEIFLT